jgi:deoxycytidylate deaminase
MNLEESMRSYDHCPAVHAEMNVIINAARSGVITTNSIMYLGEMDGTVKGMDGPCFLCRRFMIQAGIAYCYYIKDGKVIEECRLDWIEKENEWIAEQQGKPYISEEEQLRKDLKGFSNSL